MSLATTLRKSISLHLVLGKHSHHTNELMLSRKKEGNETAAV